MNNKGTILVVDDTHASLKLLTDILTAEGYTVYPADSGELALVSVAANPLDLILLDICMPGLDGFEVYRRLRTRPESTPIPVIFINEVTDVEKRVESLKLGGVDFISKPFQREELLARVQTYLELSKLRNRLKHVSDQQDEERILLRTLIDNLPDRIYVMDVQGRKLISNIADWQASGGKRMEDVIGKTDFDTYPLELAEPFWALDMEVIESGKSIFNHEEPGLDSQGKPVWVLTSKIPLRDGQGKVIGLVGIGRDITDRKQAEQTLRKSEKHVRLITDNMQDLVAQTDLQGLILYSSPSHKTLLGVEPESMLGKSIYDLIHPEDIDRVREAILASRQAQTLDKLELRYRQANGQYLWLESIGAFYFDENGAPAGAVFNSRDITERKQAEKLQDAIYRISRAADIAKGLDSLFPSIHAIIQEVMVADNIFIALYDERTDMLSFPYSVDDRDPRFSSKKPGKGLTEYVLRTGKPVLCDEALYERLIQYAEIELVGANSPIWLGVPLIVEGKVIGVMAVQDYKNARAYGERELRILELVSTQVAQAIERKRLEEEIRNLSLTDELTGLYNRRGFTLLAEQEVKQAHRIKRSMLLLFGDVDNLKRINDTHGHAHGDLALKEISVILKESFREEDIVARIGGDEFVVLALDASRERAEIMTNRIQATLEARNQKGDEPYQLSLSLGVAYYDPEAPCTLSELIAQADGLMYDQKQARKENN